MQKSVACPSCGGEQQVHNPGITLVVCQYCSTSIYWDKDAVLAAGEKSILAYGDTRLFDGAKGILNGEAFEVIGHVRYDYGAGSWDEWYLAKGEETLWLSEDERELSLERELKASPEEVPPSEMLETGMALHVNNQAYTVREVGKARCAGGWGQLPFVVLPDETYPYADIADASGERFGTLEYDRAGQPRIFLGEPLSHDTLVVEGTPPAAATQSGEAEAETGAGIHCAACGAPLDKPSGRAVETLVCPYCGSQNDLSGPEARAMGKNPSDLDPSFEFEIGDRGSFEGAEFEIIGRMLMVDDEGYEARQYLLWNRERDYLYLEEESGEFVLNRVTTQAPDEDPFDLDAGEPVRVGGQRFVFVEDGSSTLNYVDGALPWVATVGDVTDYADFSGSGDAVYGVERSAREIEYFFGKQMSRQEVRVAFGLEAGVPAAAAGPSAGARDKPPPPAARPRKKGGGCLRSCLVVGGGAVLLVVLLMVLGLVAARWALRDDGREALAKFRAAKAELLTLEGGLSEARREKSWLRGCEPKSDQWSAGLKKGRAQLEELEGTAVAELEKLVAEDSFWSYDEVGALATTLDQGREQAMAAVRTPGQRLTYWLNFERDLGGRVGSYEASYEAVASAKLDRLAQDLERAKKDWPDADHARLNKLFDEAKGTKATAKDVWAKNLAAHRAADSGQITLAVCQSLPGAWDTMQRLGDAAVRATDQIPVQILQLYTAWEKILIDMEIKEGWEISFAHRYRKVVVVAAPGKKPSPPVHTENWQSVSKEIYNASERFMGMAVAHKALGKFEDQAVQEVTPAGYSLLPPQDKNKNRFGKWQGAGQNATWRWLPAYMALGTILWGSHHTPHRLGYGSYYQARQNRQIFYGPAGVTTFGKDGSFTRNKYSGARYYSNNMFRNTRYISSGRTYRGQRYSSSYRSGSSSGSRYGGGK